MTKVGPAGDTPPPMQTTVDQTKTWVKGHYPSVGKAQGKSYDYSQGCHSKVFSPIESGRTASWPSFRLPGSPCP